MLIDGVTAGSVQRDAENAITQMKALRSVLDYSAMILKSLITILLISRKKNLNRKTRRGRKNR